MEWRDASGRRQAFYSSLPPGKYRFRVMASNNDGIWNEAGAEIDFDVDPAFYRTPWFLVLSAAATLVLLVSAYRLRLKRAQAKIHMLYEERMRERTRIGHELHDTLLQNISGLALQLDRWSKVVKDPPSAKQGLRELRRDAEDWLHEARELLWDLRSQNEGEGDFAQAVRQIGEQVLGAGSVPCRIVVSGDQPVLPARTRTNLLRIVHEGVRNAMRHSGATEIRIEIAYGAAYLLRVRVTDNGRGFDPALASSVSGHWGLSTMRERTRLIGGQFELRAATGQGAEIEITIPNPTAKKPLDADGSTAHSRSRS